MSSSRASWRNICILAAPLVLLSGPVASQTPVAPLLPVQDSPLLLPVPKAPAPSNPAGAPPISLAPTVPFATKTASSTSVGKQFTVYGGDLNLRSSFCMLCEETATALGRVLKDNGKYGLPIIVVLKTPPDITVTGPAVTYNIGELAHGGFHLQINAQLRTGFNTTEFSNELVRMLLAERILRNHQKLQTSRSDVLPAWVMTGVTQALDFRSRSRPSALFSAVFHRGQVYSLDRILSADPTQLDALSKGIYETSTCALVLTLLDQPDGPVRFAKFLNALAVESKSDRELLAQHFPNLATSQNALEKWWSLQMASLAMPSALETYGVNQTEEGLDDALMLVLPGSHEEKKETATPAATEGGEKKGGGFFRWFKREDKGGASEGTDKAGTEKPGKEAAPAPPASSSVEGAQGSESLMLYATSLLPGGMKVAFPFGKKKPADEAVDGASKETAKPEGNGQEKAGAKPSAPEKGKDTSKKEENEPPAKLSRKPGTSRSIGGRPEDLPKAPPPVTSNKKDAAPEEPPKTGKDNAKPTGDNGSEPAVEKPSMFNPRNWFRRGAPAQEAGNEKGKGENSAPTARSETPKTEAGPSPRRTTKPGSIPLEDFALIAKHPDRVDILNRCLAKLSSLKLRAHPLYKSIIADYTLVVQELLKGKSKGVADRLEELRKSRESTHEKALAVESYLDWYEANHTGTLSHSFDDFLKLDDELSKERLPRNDALSKYLDAMQQEFQDK